MAPRAVTHREVRHISALQRQVRVAELILQGWLQQVGFRLEGYKEEMHSISYMWGGTCHLLYIQMTCSNVLPENRVHLFPQVEGLCSREHILDVHLGLELPF